MTKDFTDDLRLAHLLADNADSVSMKRFKAQDLVVTTKPDSTWVSDADTATEEAIRRTLAKARPRDAVHGEEGADTGWGPRRWIIDPIDGTNNFVRGVPVWASLIGLQVDGEMVASVVSCPAMGRRWWASKGGGAFTGTTLLRPTAIRVSQVSSIPDASLSYSDISHWIEEGRGQQFVNLMRDCWRTRAYGDFWSYMLVAEGAVDIACEPSLALHDMAALEPIVTEAGGRFTSIDGTPGINGPGALATNGVLHEAAVAVLASLAGSGDARSEDADDDGDGDDLDGAGQAGH